MKLVTHVNKHTHVLNWIRLWNGGFNLTEKEQAFFGAILEKYLTLIEDGVKEPYIGELVFSTKNMNEIKDSLNLTKQGLTNYKVALKDKGVIRKNDAGVWTVLPMLVPKTEVTFSFVYDEQR